MSAAQATGNQTSQRTVSTSTGVPVQWVISRFGYRAFEAKISEYQIRSASIGNGFYLVTSKNIRMQVKSLGSAFSGKIPGTSAACADTLDRLRDAKNADDTLAYNMGGAELRVAAIEEVRNKKPPRDTNGFFMCEQHCVWAMAASARTGCVIPPEFFIDNEAFGGTAGNGPDVLYLIGGYVGGGTSTIAMGHDTDWMLGRLFAVGPLAGLNALRPRTSTQIKRAGAAGLFGPDSALLAGRDGLEPLLTAPPGRQADPAFRERVMARRAAAEELKRNVHDRIDALLTQCNAPNINFTNPDVMGNALKQGQHGWSCKFTDSYCDFGGYLLHHSGDYKWSGNEPKTQNKQDIRANNRKVTPFFSSLERT